MSVRRNIIQYSHSCPLNLRLELIRQREETNKDPNEQKQTILKLKQESLMESVFHRLKDVG